MKVCQNVEREKLKVILLYCQLFLMFKVATVPLVRNWYRRKKKRNCKDMPRTQLSLFPSSSYIERCTATLISYRVQKFLLDFRLSLLWQLGKNQDNNHLNTFSSSKEEEYSLDMPWTRNGLLISMNKVWISLTEFWNSEMCFGIWGFPGLWGCRSWERITLETFKWTYNSVCTHKKTRVIIISRWHCIFSRVKNK